MQGMNREQFIQLAHRHTGMAEQDLQNIKFRDSYGFVDVVNGRAQELMRAMNGVEFNGERLSVELASRMRRKNQRSRVG